MLRSGDTKSCIYLAVHELCAFFLVHQFTTGRALGIPLALLLGDPLEAATFVDADRDSKFFFTLFLCSWE